MKNKEICWVIKDDHIGSAFLDAGASQFLLGSVGVKEDLPAPEIAAASTSQPPVSEEETGQKRNLNQTSHPSEEPPRKKPRSQEDGDLDHPETEGASIGPGWTESLLESCRISTGNNVVVKYLSEVAAVGTSSADSWPLVVTLSNGEEISCDFVVSATGVIPNTECCGPEFKKDAEGGLLVNEFMETSVPGVFAAGDACSPSWAESPHWFQMRLWSQARTTGLRAAQSIITPAKERHADFSFEIFTHVTRFLGFRVILLGL